MRKGQKKDICPLGYWNPTVDHPELMVNATEEPRKTVADLIRTEMFHYAKSNMALVNIYIKVSKINWKMLIGATYLLDAVKSSEILKGKQKLGVTFDSHKQVGIDFTIVQNWPCPGPQKLEKLTP